MWGQTGQLVAQNTRPSSNRNEPEHVQLVTRLPTYQMSRCFYWNCGVHTEHGCLGDLLHVTRCNGPLLRGALSPK